MDIKQIMHEIRRVNAEHGFNSKVVPENPSVCAEKLMLMVSELSEALEEFRAGHAVDEIYFGPDGKPEGIPIELADCMIRIFDFAEANRIDLEMALGLKMRYNEGRPFKHGKVI